MPSSRLCSSSAPWLGDPRYRAPGRCRRWAVWRQKMPITNLSRSCHRRVGHGRRGAVYRAFSPRTRSWSSAEDFSLVVLLLHAGNAADYGDVHDPRLSRWPSAANRRDEHVLRARARVSRLIMTWPLIALAVHWPPSPASSSSTRSAKRSASARASSRRRGKRPGSTDLHKFHFDWPIAIISTILVGRVECSPRWLLCLERRCGDAGANGSRARFPMASTQLLR